MTSASKFKTKPQSVHEWVGSNRLLEVHLFLYFLLVVYLGFVGLYSFGFELQGYSAEQNLLANFVWFLVLAAIAPLAPLWSRLFYSNKARHKRRVEQINARLEVLTNPALKAKIRQHLINKKGPAPRPLKKWSLIFLGWCALFEMFFVSSWVRDLALVWQPEWVQSLISWVRVNTNVPPLNIDRKLFMISLEGSDEGSVMLSRMFETEQQFLHSDFGEACLLYHAWHVVSFLPMLAASLICMWGRISLEDKKGFAGYTWLAVVTFFMTLMLIGGVYMILRDVGYRAGSVTGLVGWVQDFWVHIAYFFIFIALRLYTNWFVKIKAKFVALTRRLQKVKL